MHPKIKSRPAGKSVSVSTVKPPMAHDMTNQTASINAAARRPEIATQPASGTANHSRHHVSRQTQA